MNEDDARLKMQAALNRLRANRSALDEENIETHTTSVNYHVDTNIKSGEGDVV